MTRFTFECLACGRYFPLRRNFAQHVEREHLRKWPDKDIEAHAGVVA